MSEVRAGSFLLLFFLMTGCRQQMIPAKTEPARITLTPTQDTMFCQLTVPTLENRTFVLMVPETIAARETPRSPQSWLFNIPDAQGPDALKKAVWASAPDGSVEAQMGFDGLIACRVRLVPMADSVGIATRITNLGGSAWHDVFAFHCLAPQSAKAEFLDPMLARTYMSQDGSPKPLSAVRRVNGPRPGIDVFLPKGQQAPHPFAAEFRATSPDRTDGAWLASLSEPPGFYMAMASPKIACLFHNSQLGCLHACPAFGDIPAGESREITTRVYFGKGSLEHFLERYKQDRF